MTQLQDPLTMAAKRLGEAKTEATTMGIRLIDVFEKLQKEVAVLKEHGLAVTTIEFEEPAIQAAWFRFTAPGEWGEMPLMETEETIVTRIQAA